MTTKTVTPVRPQSSAWSEAGTAAAAEAAAEHAAGSATAASARAGRDAPAPAAAAATVSRGSSEDSVAQQAPSGPPSSEGSPPTATDGRRRLQLVLAALWLLDGLLQFQPFMFTKDFASMSLDAVADGAPGWLAHSITWSTGIIQNHPVGTNTAFAVIQLALGLGIAWRPTVKVALLASIGWSAAVWWFGEGFGGLFSGGGDPITGAPGAVILYAVLAVLLWPTDKPIRPAADGRVDRHRPFEAARFVGGGAARVVWFVLWAGLAALAVLPANTAPGTIGDAITGTDTGAPGWQVWLDNHAASLIGNHDLAVSIVLAVLFGAAACAIWLPWRRAVVAALVAVIVVSALIWVFGEGFGMPYMGMATDPNSGPLLVLLAAAYWPARARLRASTAAPSVPTARGAGPELPEEAA